MQIFIKIISCIFLITASHSAVYAQTDKYDSIYTSCVKESGGTVNNAIVYKCSDMVSQQAKADINQYFHAIHTKLSQHNPTAAKKLTLAQKSWLKYRNAHCELMGEYVGSPMYSYCPMLLNSARALELKNSVPVIKPINKIK